MVKQGESEEKIYRVLGIYTKLMNGAVVNKAEEAINYGVNERSIQRDIEDIRDYLDKAGAETGNVNSVVHPRQNTIVTKHWKPMHINLSTKTRYLK